MLLLGRFSFIFHVSISIILKHTYTIYTLLTYVCSKVCMYIVHIATASQISICKPHLKLDGKLDQLHIRKSKSISKYAHFVSNLSKEFHKKMVLQKRGNFKKMIENCNPWSHYCFLSMLMLQIMTRRTNT